MQEHREKMEKLKADHKNKLSLKKQEMGKLEKKNEKLEEKI